MRKKLQFQKKTMCFFIIICSISEFTKFYFIRQINVKSSNVP